MIKHFIVSKLAPIEPSIAIFEYFGEERRPLPKRITIGPASETPLEWRFAPGPMVVRHCLLALMNANKSLCSEMGVLLFHAS